MFIGETAFSSANRDYDIFPFKIVKFSNFKAWDLKFENVSNSCGKISQSTGSRRITIYMF